MSSARSVASARAKRAGLNEPIKPNYSSTQMNSSVMSNQTSGDKLSISHAITLITLRLGKLETYIQKLETDILPLMLNNTVMNDSFTNKESYDINYEPLEEKMNLLINRMNSLEKENISLHNKIQILELQSTKTIIQEIQKSDTSIEKEEILNELKEYILPVETEITKLKDLLLYLQNNSLEINQKLINILFNNLNGEEEDLENIELQVNEIFQENEVALENEVVTENEIVSENEVESENEGFTENEVVAEIDLNTN